jgi:deazaflavin-dependent oxidoreductase (nitroreductase family)
VRVRAERSKDSRPFGQRVPGAVAAEEPRRGEPSSGLARGRIVATRHNGAAHRAVYRATGGRVGKRMGKAPVLLLTTTGRTSGRERTIPLLFLADGAGWIVVASNGGRDEHPAWWRDLLAKSAATVEVGKVRTAVSASEVEGPERERLWAKLAEMFPNYDEYRKKTERATPVVRLTRAD